MDFDNLLHKSNTTNYMLITNTTFKGSVAFVKLLNVGKIFCEVGYSLYGEQKYYDLEEFLGTNIIRRCVSKNFSDTADVISEMRSQFLNLAVGCAEEKGPIADYLFDDMIKRELCTFVSTKITPLSLAEINAFGTWQKERVIAYIHETQTGKLIYIIDNVVYSEHFPVEWALNPGKFSWEFEGKEEPFIMGPGTSSIHCANCNYFGSINGVFIGYCANCAEEYDYTRGNGFIKQGVEYTDEDGATICNTTYLSGLDLATLGYYPEPEEKYNNCLSGGEVPTGPDICDDQEDMDPIREDEIDEYVYNSTGLNIPSRRYPRRAYSMPSVINRMGTILGVEQTETMTPDFIRHKLEIFMESNNAIESTNNNYSFPIGQRPDWDHYRITKQPSSWFSWNAVLRGPSGCEDVEFEILLNVSNVHSTEHPARMILECNRVYGRSPAYWNMMRTIRAWILDEIDDPMMHIVETRPHLNRSSEPVHIPQFSHIPLMNYILDEDEDALMQ